MQGLLTFPLRILKERLSPDCRPRRLTTTLSKILFSPVQDKPQPKQSLNCRGLAPQVGPGRTLAPRRGQSAFAGTPKYDIAPIRQRKSVRNVAQLTANWNSVTSHFPRRSASRLYLLSRRSHQLDSCAYTRILYTVTSV